MNHGDLDQAEDKEEEFDAVPAHFFSSTEFKKLWPEIKEEEVALKVTKKLSQPLGVTDQMTGCVYIISPRDAKFRGMLKVGFSKKHPKFSRFKSYQGCIGSFDVIKVKSVTCAHRVEQLLFAEFSHVHYGMKCQKCLGTHQEWLKIDKKAILESLNKWCSFFDETAPYKPDGQLDTLPEDGPTLPSPVLRKYLSQGRSAKSSPLKTPSKKAGTKKSPSKETPTKKSPARTTPETPTKTFQHHSSSLASPSNYHLKIPTITTTALTSSDGEDSTTQETEMENELDPEADTVGWISAFRRLVFT
jgi:hypothetical protein